MNILEICADTRQGERELNEDSYVLLHDGMPENVLALVAVADGIGGMGSGHVASSTALTTIVDIFRKLSTQYGDREDPPIMDWLSFCFQKANATLMRMGLTIKELRGLGTTCTAAAITKPGKLYICHVGDSRAYLMRDGVLKQITEDDWFRGIRDSGTGRTAAVKTRNGGLLRDEENQESGLQSGMTLVTQAIGWQPFIDPAKHTIDLHRDDVILLCTDGLTDNLRPEEIEQIIGGGQDVCSRLVDNAAGKSGSDNTTAAVVRIGD